MHNGIIPDGYKGVHSPLPRTRTAPSLHGMPGEAIRLDAATLVLPPEKIAAVLARLAKDGQ